VAALAHGSGQSDPLCEKSENVRENENARPLRG
jgi:hypothetical protein